MSEFFFKRLGKAEQEALAKESRMLVSSFLQKLEQVDLPEEGSFINRGEGTREEGFGCEQNANFRKYLLENAPEHTKEGTLVSEKKQW